MSHHLSPTLHSNISKKNYFLFQGSCHWEGEGKRTPDWGSEPDGEGA